MEQKIIFREMLGEIKKKAEQNGNVLTRKEVEDFFAHAQMTGEQLDMICEYLNEQMIRIVDWSAQDGGRSVYAQLSADAAAAPDPQAQTDEETAGNGDRAADGEAAAGRRRILEQYVEDVAEMTGLETQEEEILFQAAAEGDMNARNRLISAYLPIVLDMAGEMETDGIVIEDLIQEGNMGLILAFDTLEKGVSLAGSKAHIMNEIGRAMQEALEQQTKLRQMDSNTVRKVNSLHEAAKRMEEELGCKPSAEELSAYLEMPLEEIMDILGLSGEKDGQE